MRFSRLMAWTTLALSIALSTQALAQTTRPASPAAPAGAPPAGGPAAKGLVGEVRFTTLQGFTYYHTNTEATAQAAPMTGMMQLGQMMQGMKPGAPQIAGAPIITIIRNPDDPKAKVKVQAGYPTQAAGNAPANTQLTKVEPERCAVVLYSGPAAGIGAAYNKLMAEILGSGSTPTGVTRQHMFFWEDENSPNNVFMIVAGIQ